MSKRIFLGLAVHNHQPVGNFPYVFAEAYERAYEPMVALLERHPTIRMTLHYSGPLRDWVLENRPEFIGRIAALVARGQVEVMTGGYYEPILVAIPDADKFGQMAKLTQAVREDFGCEARGAWLAERVWEPHLAKVFADAGVEYTVVDDTHFKHVGLEDEDLFGYYVTEEQGATLKVFATSKWMRYSIPWLSVEEVIAYLRDKATEEGNRIAVMGDDGEKFGIWPGTHRHVWEKGWGERFFTALEENSGWLQTITLGDYARRFPALGRIYLPTTSYDEMGEWALPAAVSGDIVQLKHQLQGERRDDILRFIRGGFWRYFMVKYPEVNTMHKKMLLVSGKVHRMASSPLKERALDELWKGQCNCPYWHGVFGGVYLPHIRVATYEHLVAAENLADETAHPEPGWLDCTEYDFDCDAQSELLVSGEAMNLYFDPADGGTLFEWDWRGNGFNLLNNMTRRPEGYHRLLEEAKGTKETGRVKTIHEIVRVKEEGLEKLLHYDWYRRAALIDHFLHPDTTLMDFYRSAYGELGDFVNQLYHHQVSRGQDSLTVTLARDGHLWQGEALVPLRLEKQVLIPAGSTDLPVRYTLTNTGQGAVDARFGVEMNFGLLSGHSADAFYHIPGVELEDAHLDSLGEAVEIGRLSLVNRGLGMEIGLELSRPATLWRFPIETISNSESGFERGYQCSCILPHWRVMLAPGESWEVHLNFSLRG